eukprot:7274623-Prymnesium_polylepis.1
MDQLGNGAPRGFLYLSQRVPPREKVCQPKHGPSVPLSLACHDVRKLLPRGDRRCERGDADHPDRELVASEKRGTKRTCKQQ